MEPDLVLEGLTDIENSDDEEFLEEVHADIETMRQQQEVQLPHEYFIARDGTRWNKEPPITRRLRAHNVVRAAGGNARRGTSPIPIDIFKKIITEEIIDIITRETNRKAESEIAKNNENNSENQSTWTPLTDQELYAYIGILLAAGLCHSNMQHTIELWKTNNSPVFRATMSLHRFRAIGRFIRFDNFRTRAERQKIDKAAAIRDIWIMDMDND